MIGTNRWWRAMASVVAGVCLAVVATVASSAPSAAVVTVKIATGNGSQGGPLTLTLSMSREVPSESVATLQTDVIFDTNQLDLVGACGSTGAACRLSSDCGDKDICQFTPAACQKDPRLSQQQVDVVPPDYQNVQAGQRRIRMSVVATRLPVPTFTDGNVLTCTFQVLPQAPVGKVVLSADRLQVADNAIPAQQIPAVSVIEAGTIYSGTPGPTSTATLTVSPTGTPPTATPTVGSPTPTPGEMTPTPGERTPCPSPRPAPEGPAMYIQDTNVLMSGVVPISILLSTGGQEIAGTQNDIGFGGNVVINRKANGKPDCAVNADIDKGATSFAFQPPGCTVDTCTAVRALVLSTDNTNPIADGSVLYTCQVTVAGEGGELPMTGVIMSGPTGQRIPGATGRGGEVCVEPEPTRTPTGTLPATATMTTTPSTATPTRSPEGPTVTATSGSRTATPTRTAVSQPTATNTPGGGGGGGSGCNCSISREGSTVGSSLTWLVLPAALLLWRRRSR